ncbi:MAG: maleylpyruvate isomerase N-terminal domain-containing protein [Chloroflexota bacterium]|nr:MAG: maleylpyruvate isomerase N-terminal domain-containing protein [Chloroflexota bacterium]
MIRQFVAENAKGRERLRNFVDKITDEELTLTLNAEGWTVAVALAHLAFWDERRLVLVRKWKKEGITPSPIDADIINDALVPLLLAIPPRKAANLSITIAEALDRELEEASPDLIEAMEASGDIHALDRSIHRNLHLDEIDALLKTKRQSR